MLHMEAMVSANSVRVTLVFPHELWEEVKRIIPSGERSRVIAEATERELQQRKQWAAFQRARVLGDGLAARYGEFSDSTEDIRKMREARDAELSDLR